MILAESIQESAKTNFQDMKEIALIEHIDSADWSVIAYFQKQNLEEHLRRCSEQQGLSQFYDLQPRCLPKRILTPDNLAEFGPPKSRQLILPTTPPAMILRSSGTGGMPKTVEHTWEFFGQVGFLGARGVKSATNGSIRRIMNLMQPGSLNGGFLFVQELARVLRVLCLPMGATQDYDGIAKLLEEYEIDSIAGQPLLLMDLFLGLGNALPSSVRYLLFCGESFPVGDRLLIESACPNVRVRSLAYSTNETGPIGYHCSELSDNTYHLHDDAVFVEIVDPETLLPVDEGQTGLILITAMSGSGMGILRYQVGDLGSIASGKCKCGSETRRLTLRGRQDTLMRLDTATLSEAALVRLISGLHPLPDGSFQLQARWKNRRFKLHLLLHVDSPFTSQDYENALRQDFHFNRALNSKHCDGFEMTSSSRTEFWRTSREKVLNLVEIHEKS